jgi:hypothetical protein
MLPGGVRSSQLILPVDDCPLSGSVWAEEIEIVASMSKQIQTKVKQLCISLDTDFRGQSFKKGV